ncbi:MAG: metal ABC transporter substrate-binding protein [Candidatus Scalindua sp.]|nr:metal ABC transporter substrate-binding protein [Candidatus Scalindua sp.]MCR4343776.1 metal ABC transporter substrate-binding protein [Candidatus Scalindua sp.]
MISKFLTCIIFVFAVSWASAAYAKLNIVASTPDLGAVAKEIGEDKIKITNIARPTEDPHFVDARPSFMVKLNKADILIEGGLQLEIGWLPPLVMGARNNKILPGQPGYLTASTGINVLQVPQVVSRAMGDVHPYGNPHYMLDPLNAKIVASHICARLCLLDKENCKYYQDNLKDFIKRLDKKLTEWEKMLEPYQGTKIVTYHRTFPYFAQRFHLEVMGSLEPKPGISPSPSHINNLVPMMKSEGVKLIIIEDFRERKTPEFVASKTGAKVVVLPIMVGGRKETDDYISFVDYNVNQVVSALKNE